MSFADFQDFANAADAPPCKFTDMNHSFQTRLQLDECSKVSDSSDLSTHGSSLGIAFSGALPGILSQLLHAETDSLLFRIEFQNLDIHRLTFCKDVTRMIDS